MPYLERRGGEEGNCRLKNVGSLVAIKVCMSFIPTERLSGDM